MTRLSVKYVEKWEGTRYALDLCPQCYSTTKNVFQDKNTINELHDLCRQNAMRPPQQRYEARIDWGGTETARTYAEAGQEAPTGTTR